MFLDFYKNNHYKAPGMIQKHGYRYLVHNPQAAPLKTEELDHIYNLGFENDIHPYYKNLGKVTALDTTRFSITTHRGCFGECSFCSIAIHQGHNIISRSKESILKEANDIANDPDFNGIIRDLGGPTANMYSQLCYQNNKSTHCNDRKCLYPKICKNLNVNHEKI